MPSPVHIEQQARHLISDAAALGAIVACGDLRRLHVHDQGTLDVGDGRHMVGASIGTGHALAAVLGHRDGQPAVCCATRLIVRHCLQRGGSLEITQAVTECVVLHELAHTLVAAEIPPERVRVLLDSLVTSGPPTYTAAATAAAHGSQWAAALVVLSDRARRYRPQAARMLTHAVVDDLQHYGHDAAALRAAVGQVDDCQPLRELLADPALLARLPIPTIPDPQQAQPTSRDAALVCATTR